MCFAPTKAPRKVVSQAIYSHVRTYCTVWVQRLKSEAEARLFFWGGCKFYEEGASIFFSFHPSCIASSLFAPASDVTFAQQCDQNLQHLSAHQTERRPDLATLPTLIAGAGKMQGHFMRIIQLPKMGAHIIQGPLRALEERFPIHSVGLFLRVMPTAASKRGCTSLNVGAWKLSLAFKPMDQSRR